MAQALSLQIKGDIDLTAVIQKMNALLQNLKTSMGSLGNKIELIDAEKLQKDFQNIDKELSKQAASAQKAASAMGNLSSAIQKGSNSGTLLEKSFKFNQIAQSLQIITQALSEFSAPFIQFEAQLADMSAITGVQGEALDKFGVSARNLAKEFGGSAMNQIEAFKGILSKLGPDIAKSPEGLERMALAINTLAKASGLDAAQSMQILTGAVQAFNDDLSDPIAAAEEMTRKMNIMAASAKEGSAELPDLSAGLDKSGTSAKNANISFEETIAALQTIDAGNIKGAESGTALRNMLGLLQKQSGPGAAELKKMGISVEELGRKLNTEGLGSALTTLKSGLETIKDSSERNAALMTIFGQENANAANILLSRVDSMKDLASKITGTNVGFEQAAINMGTMESKIDRVKTAIQDGLITAFQGLGKGATVAIGAVTQLSPVLTGLGGLSQIIPDGALGKMKDFAATILSKVVPGLLVQATATGTATAAQWSFNAAALANPYLLAAAGFAVVIASIKLISAALHDTAAEQKEANDGALKMVDAQIAVADKQRGLIQNNASLVESFKAQGKAAMNNKDLLMNLAKAYPGVIDTTKSYDENLKRLTSSSQQSIDKLKSLDDSMNELQLKRSQLEQKSLIIDVAIKKEDFENNLTNIIGEVSTGGFFKNLGKSLFDVSNFGFEIGKSLVEWKAPDLSNFEKLGANITEFLFGTSTIRKKVENQVKVYTDALSAGNSIESIKAAGDKWALAIMNGEGEFAKLNETQKLQLIKNAEDVTKAKVKQFEEQKKASANYLAGAIQHGVTEDKIMKTLMEGFKLTNAEAKKMLISGVLDQATKAGSLTEDQIKKIADKYGYTTDQIKQMIKDQKAHTAEVKKTEDAAKSLGDAFSEAMKQAKEEQGKAIANLAGLKKELADGVITQKQYNEQSKQYLNQGIAATKTYKQATDLQKRAAIEIGAEENKNSSSKEKAGKSAYELAKKQYEQEKKSTKNAEEQADLQAEFNRLTIGREKNILDEIAANKNNLSILETQKERLNEIYKLKVDDNGKVIDIGIKLKKGEDKETIISDLNNELLSINNDISKNNNKALELNIKANLSDEELQKKLKDLQLSQLKYDISIGLKNNADLVEFLQEDYDKILEQVKIGEEKVTALKKQYEVIPGGDSKESIALKNDLDAQLKSVNDHLDKLNEVEQTKRLELEKEKESIRQESFKKLDESNKAELDAIQKKIESEKTLQKIVIDTLSATSTSAVDQNKQNQLDKLEKDKKAEIITEDEYNKRKLEIETNAQLKIENIKEMARGMELEAERQQTVLLLEEQEKRLLAKQKLLDPIKDKAEYDKVAQQLTELNLQIQEKGDILTAYSTELQAGMTSIFSNLLGDGEGTKESARKVFAQIVGILKKAASAAVVNLVLGQLGILATGSGLGALVAAPFIKVFVEAGINKILDPILNNLLSFSTGGKVNEPTIAVIGDASKSRPGDDTEWIFRDDHIWLIVDNVIKSRDKEFKNLINYIVDNLNFSANDFTQDKDFFKLLEMDLTVNEHSKVLLSKVNDNMINLIKTIQDVETEKLNTLTYDNLVSVTEKLVDITNLNNRLYDNTISTDEYLRQYGKIELQVISMASGGVRSTPTLSLIGDAGTNNPEYVLNSPQLRAVIQETANSTNVKTNYLLEQIFSAIKEQKLDVYLDNTKVTDEINRENNRRKMKNNVD